MRDILAELAEERQALPAGQRPEPQAEPLNIFEQEALSNEAAEALAKRFWGKHHPLLGNVNRKIAFAVLTGRLKMLQGVEETILRLWVDELLWRV